MNYPIRVRFDSLLFDIAKKKVGFILKRQFPIISKVISGKRFQWQNHSNPLQCVYNVDDNSESC